MPNTKWLIPDITTKQDLSASGGTVLDFTTTVGRPFKLDSIHINVNDGADPPVAVAIIETITITRKSAKGRIYDSIIAKVDLISQSNFVFRLGGEPTFQADDEINIHCTAANATGIVHSIVKAEELHT